MGKDMLLRAQPQLRVVVWPMEPVIVEEEEEEEEELKARYHTAILH